MYPELDLGPLSLQTFGLCFALGFVAAGAVLSRRLRELGRPPDWSYEIVFSALVGGLVGARLDYLIENWDNVSHDLLGSLFSGSGLVWFGGAVGGAAGVVIWAWRRGWLRAQMLDTVAIPLALGYAIGRVGCQLSGDGDYGVSSDLPWAMAYPDGTVPTTEEVHPTPVYETLAVGLLTLALWRLRDRFAPGVLFGIYLLFAGFERFLVEFVRRNDELVAGLTLPQVIGLALMAGGAAVILSRRGQRVEPARAAA
ncbi:MAG TPA: prolipoprotein diacylglyceryl transferase family protein [Thermoleophilaceae bacterium]|nr:prolipoprotein diacylglyceryl transferase family protein [Thermoleophilaceae bacterium]